MNDSSLRSRLENNLNDLESIKTEIEKSGDLSEELRNVTDMMSALVAFLSLTDDEMLADTMDIEEILVAIGKYSTFIKETLDIGKV